MSGTTANPKPRLSRPGSGKANRDPHDELLKKFSNTFRKAMENRDNNNAGKCVKFNPETVDVSIGGTKSHGMIKMDVSTDVSMSSTSLSTSSEDTSGSINETVIEQKPSGILDVPSSVPGTGVLSAVPRNLTRNGGFYGSPVRRSEDPVKGYFSPSVAGKRTPVGQACHTGPLQTPDYYQAVAFATPLLRNLKHRRSSTSEMDASMEQDGSSVTVAVRVRPFSAKETAKPASKCVVSMINNETTVTSESGAVNRFTYDYSFWSFDKIGGTFADQRHVYNTLAQPMLGRAFEGYNVCLFAYGQTGSGKSYSIMGHGEEDPGIVPRFCEELFGRIETKEEPNVSSNVEISFFEIYNEKIHDLLAHSVANKVLPGKRLNLKVREDPLLGPFVEGLSKYVVRSFDDIKGWLNVGNKHRATAATGMNEKSSRSHSVFTLVLTQTRLSAPKPRRPFVGIVPGLTDEIEGEEHEHSVTSKINLVDLAGSERQSHSKTSGDRLREGASINKSLHTLGKVISLLSEQSNSNNKKKKVFIPYRDSVLTWLLKESLGGNAKTAMLATIGPADIYVEETLSTLRYANQARSIINMARVNEDANARLIRELRGEIEKLRSQTSSGVTPNDGLIGASLAEIAALKDKLSAKEWEMAEMTRSWQERLARSEERKLEEAQLLERSGISFQVDNKRPSLVNLNEDPQLSETLLYILKDGLTRIGQQAPGTCHDIQLHGPLIAENHCVIKNVDGVVNITPSKDAQTYVNGNQITKATVLHHGDRVILGGDHYFRFSHPVEALKGRKSTESGATPSKGAQLKDFEFAKQELIRVQNERLQAELEAAKRCHLEEMEKKIEKERSVAQQQLALEMDRKKREAEQELKLQRHEYEERLAELERMLREQKQERLETEQDRQAAQGRIKKLEKEKHMLETEVLSNMKRLEQEAQESQKNMAESRHQHSRLVDQLERERQKIQKDVERIEQIRLKRGATPSTPRLTPARARATETARTDLYRHTLLLREANKISQYFKKDVVYSREEVGQGEDMQALIKVTNTKLDISTFWPVHKFEARLLHMRELFQSCDPENNPGEADEVFSDMNDTWERADRGISPNILRNLKRTTGKDVKSHLSFSSVSSADSLDTDFKFSAANFESVRESPVQEGPSVVSMCRDYISTALNRFTEVELQESVVDKVLCRCEVLKASITAMLESFNQASESTPIRGAFLASPVMQANSIQIATNLEIVLGQCALWVGSYEALTSGLVRDLCTRIISTARKLGTHLVLFMQGCENDIDTLVQESAGQALGSLFNLSKHCGELAVATETAMVCLSDTRGSTGGEEEEEEARIKVGHDIRQSFLTGCDLFVDKTLQGSLKTVVEQEVRLQSVADDTENMTTSMDEVVNQVALVTGSAKVLLERCQRLQVELDSTIRDSLTESKPEWYYSRSYSRAQSLVSHVSNLAETVTHLAQGTQAYAKGSDPASLRKLCRLGELVQKSALKLHTTSNMDPIANSTFSDSRSETSDISILSESHMDELEVAAMEVKMSTESLMNLTKKHQEAEPGAAIATPVRSKRMLPVSPVRGSGMTRRDSFKEKSTQKKVQALKRAFENSS